MKSAFPVIACIKILVIFSQCSDLVRLTRVSKPLYRSSYKSVSIGKASKVRQGSYLRHISRENPTFHMYRDTKPLEPSFSYKGESYRTTDLSSTTRMSPSKVSNSKPSGSKPTDSSSSSHTHSSHKHTSRSDQTAEGSTSEMLHRVLSKSDTLLKSKDLIQSFNKDEKK